MKQSPGCVWYALSPCVHCSSLGLRPFCLSLSLPLPVGLPVSLLMSSCLSIFLSLSVSLPYSVPPSMSTCLSLTVRQLCPHSVKNLGITLVFAAAASQERLVFFDLSFVCRSEIKGAVCSFFFKFLQLLQFYQHDSTYSE